MSNHVKILRIGLPNQGRLGQLARSIFTDYLQIADTQISHSRKYSHLSRDGRIEFIFARSEDLPHLTAQGVLDLCITGRDYVEESRAGLVELLDLGLCPGVVSVLAPIRSSIKNVADLNGRTIATQLPRIAQTYLETNNLTAKIQVNKGANEVYPHLGLADATIDVVSTGRTARDNGLAPIAMVMQTSGGLWTSARAYATSSAEISALVLSIEEVYVKDAHPHTPRRVGLKAQTIS